MAALPLDAIVSFLDRRLRVEEFSDNSNNGLQVRNSGTVRRICIGVDACQDFFVEAAQRDADLLITHHGLSWGDSLKRITGLNYRRLKFLLEHDMALYACHLPLDAHPEVGNNAQICRALGLIELNPFGSSLGPPVGFSGMLPEPVQYAELKNSIRAVLNNTVATMDFGRERVRSVAVVSGAGASEIGEAAEKGIDVFISGEPRLTAYHQAREYGINAIFGGHYATEVFGVQAVGTLLNDEFGIGTEFIDMGIVY